MSTNNNIIKTTKSAKVSIKAESDKMDKPFIFTGKGEVTFSANGNLTFAGTGKFTKTKESTVGPANNDTAVLTLSESSTHLGLPPVPILKMTEDQTDMVPPESQSLKTISSGKQLMHNGKNSSASASMAPANSEMSSQPSGPGIPSTSGASNKTGSHLADSLGPEDYTPENLAALREENRQRFARIDQRLSELGENGKVARRAKTIEEMELGCQMADEMNRVLDTIEAGFCDETRASLAKYRKHERLALIRYDLIIVIACEVEGPEAARKCMNEILKYNAPLTYEEAMTIQCCMKWKQGLFSTSTLTTLWPSRASLTIQSSSSHDASPRYFRSPQKYSKPLVSGSCSRSLTVDGFWTSEAVKFGFERSVSMKKTRRRSFHVVKLGVVAKTLRDRRKKRLDDAGCEAEEWRGKDDV
ncbi:hypothetical protein KCU81_g1509, partial [Aureobasidium melanogenum]|uniref:Uncharacterized protein n=1 Tax=Aureobasidium melanogenum (strain CBS 110374) TaxID=1043003 RepID=A0A074W0D4_AURM1